MLLPFLAAALLLACEPVIARDVLDQEIGHYSLAVLQELNSQSREPREACFRACVLSLVASSVKIACKDTAGKCDRDNARNDSPERRLLNVSTRILRQNFGRDLHFRLFFVRSFAHQMFHIAALFVTNVFDEFGVSRQLCSDSNSPRLSVS